MHEIQPMLCPNCQTEIQQGSKFCLECGRRITRIGDSSSDRAPSQDDLRNGKMPEPVTTPIADASNPCSACGLNNPSDAKFCESCGADMKLPCPECGHGHNRLKRYCGCCGTETAAFLRVQNSVTKMEQDAGEKNYYLVLTGAEYVKAQGFKPCGSKGEALVQKASQLYQQALETARRRAAIEKSICSEWYGARRTNATEAMLTEYVALAGGLPDELKGIRQQVLNTRLLLMSKHLDAANWIEATSEAQRILKAEPDNRDAKEAVIQAQAQLKCEHEITQALTAWDKSDFITCATACQQAMAIAGGDFKFVSGTFKGLCSELYLHASSRATRKRRRRFIWSVILGTVVSITAIELCLEAYVHHSALVATQQAEEGRIAAKKMKDEKALRMVAAQAAIERTAAAAKQAAVRQIENAKAEQAALAAAWARNADAAQALINELRGKAASVTGTVATALLVDTKNMLTRLNYFDNVGLPAGEQEKLNNLKKEIGQLRIQFYPTLNQSWENSLGMQFVPVPGTAVLFGIWEVRVQDYDLFVKATGQMWPESAFKQGPTHPAVEVSWDDAQKFCSWLTQKERGAGLIGPSQEYRLPKDWEWSVAVGLNEPKEGTPKDKGQKIIDVYPWNNGHGIWPPPQGAGNYAPILHLDDFENTSPVGSFAANSLGLFDMGGNVWQWCEDCYDNLIGARTLRGGSWRNLDSRTLLSSSRNCEQANARNDRSGFRVVLATTTSAELENKPTPSSMKMRPEAGKVVEKAIAPEQLKEPKPGDALTVDLGGGVRLDLVWIPAGEFLMGRPAFGDESRSTSGTLIIFTDESPQHRVTISTGFWMGKYEVTQQQYQQLIGDNPSNFKGTTLPVEQVTWKQAKVFCEQLQARLPAELRSKTARLPTEAEWEYACRSGTTGPYAGELDDMGWYEQNSQSTTHPVGQKRPNAWGLYDMHGNVCEWCGARQRGYTSSAKTDPGGVEGRDVVRGGNCLSPAMYCRSAQRDNKISPRYLRTARLAHDYIGFRVVLAFATTTAQEGLPTPPSQQLSPEAGKVVAMARTPEKSKEPKLGEAVRLDLGSAVRLDLVWIPPGEFIMGSPSTESGRDKSEGPQHSVTISTGFWMGKYEVSQRQYEQVMSNNPSKFQGADFPVEQVDWYQAEAFCGQLQVKLPAVMRGKKARLPTEAEWEYACRAGTTGPYAGKLDDMGWYEQNSRSTTHPVGQKHPNAWGLFDMHGNVWEWCEDGYAGYTASAQTDPEGTGSSRVVRGGCWFFLAQGSRSAYRNDYAPAYRCDDLGFRVVVR